MPDLQNEIMSEIYGSNQKAQLQKWIVLTRWVTHEEWQKDFSKITQSNWSIVGTTIKFS